MNILRITDILNAPNRLTTDELNQLADYLPKLISEQFIDIAMLIIKNASAGNLFTRHYDQVSTLLLAIERGEIQLLQLLYDKGYRLEQPDVTSGSGPYDHKLYVAICRLISSGIFHDKPIDDFISALTLIRKLSAPDLFEIKLFTHYALSYYGKLGKNPTPYYRYFDALFADPLNPIDDLDILKTHCQLTCHYYLNTTTDIQCDPGFFPYLIPKRKPVSEEDILRSITPMDGRDYIDTDVVRALFQEIRAYYRDGMVFFFNGQIEMKKIMDILVKTDTSWDAGCHTLAVFDGLRLDETGIRALLIEYGMSTEKIEKLIIYISKNRRQHTARAQYNQFDKMIENKDIDALLAIPAAQLLKCKDSAWNGDLTKFIDQYHSDPIFLLLAIFDYKKRFLNMLCDINQMEVIKTVHEDVIRQMDPVQWLLRRAVFKQQYNIIAIWSALFPNLKRLSTMSNAFDIHQKNIATDANKKGVPFDEAIALSMIPPERQHYHDFDTTSDEILLSSLMEMPAFLEFKQAYQALDPIIKLACLIEGRGSAEYAHLLTLRLAFLFRSKEKAIMYLAQHQSQYPELTIPVHDACISLQFPQSNPSSEDGSPQGIWNVSIWSDLILRLGVKATKFLKWAVVIEDQMTADGKAIYLLEREQIESLRLTHHAALEKKYTESVLKQTQGCSNVDPQKMAATIEKNTLRALTGMSNKQLEHLVSDRLSTKNNDFHALPKQEKIKHIGKYIRCNHLLRMNGDDLLQFLMTHGYKRTEENPDFARECIVAGMMEYHFNQCLDLMKIKRRNDKIPDLLIEGHTLGYPNFYLKKLAPDDSLGFILGEKTNCCQSVGKEGGRCAIHGMTSEFGGFYVLFKKVPGRDKVIAQTWAWISERGNLVFDSIENLKRFDQQMILTFYTEAAISIVQRHQHIDRVVVGMGGNTPDIPSATKIQKDSDLEKPRDYDDYRDSETAQNILASQKEWTITTEEYELTNSQLTSCGYTGLKVIQLIEELKREASSQWPRWKNSRHTLLSIVRTIRQSSPVEWDEPSLQEKLQALDPAVLMRLEQVSLQLDYCKTISI